MNRKDTSIRQTNNDALVSKISAISKGYFQDEYLCHFTDPGMLSLPPRLPLMNIGTYLRVKAIDLVVDKFLERTATSPRQIVSLGAGSDTRPFHLLKREAAGSLVYHEIDFPESTGKKIAQIAASRDVSNCICLTKIRDLSDELHTENYHLHALDLRRVRADSPPLVGLRVVPTLILSECCLCYISPEECARVLLWLNNKLVRQETAFVAYEPMSGNDSFGQVMARNLASRGLNLLAFDSFPSLESQKLRFAQYFDCVMAVDLLTVLESWLTPENAKLLWSLEFVDEREELNLLFKHYCLIQAGQLLLS